MTQPITNDGYAAPVQERVLTVEDLCTWFHTPSGVVKAADSVNFHVNKQDILAIVGESGSGKSVTALSLMRLIPTPPGRYVRGRILLGEDDVLTMNERQLEQLRGGRIAMIFQNPRAALNPSFQVLGQLVETIRWHKPALGRAEAREIALTHLRDVGIGDPVVFGRNYPHQISSGMCQRLGLALALASQPELLIADEPSTNLDSTVQAKILLILEQTHLTRGLPIILITHDFGVVKALSTRIMVMYGGMVQESGDAACILQDPQHPYTRALIASVPRVGRNTTRLYQIPGLPPDLSRLPPGCSFAPRCDQAMPICAQTPPEIHCTPSGSLARCHRFAPQGGQS